MGNIIVLSIMIFIAFFVHDQIIRPFLGDVLIVIWMYLFFRSFLKSNAYKLAFIVLMFSFAIEIAQYFNLVNILGLQDNTLARIAIGTTFDMVDIFAYFIGWLAIVLVEKFKKFWLKSTFI